MSADTRTPAGLADMLTEQAVQAHTRAFQRYPHNRTERLADEAAQLRTLIEVAVDQLRSMEKP